ncbi:MAG TPA: hypothetical protein PLO78_06545 [Candidatus Omnitrophota bacterium]|nr:hypothetical protein [Candidatus Omnitrophota bacterium]
MKNAKIFHTCWHWAHEMSSYRRIYFLGLLVMAGRVVSRVFLNLWDMIE